MVVRHTCLTISSRAALISFRFAVFTLTIGNGSVASVPNGLDGSIVDALVDSRGMASPTGVCFLLGAIFPNRISGSISYPSFRKPLSMQYIYRSAVKVYYNRHRQVGVTTRSASTFHSSYIRSNPGSCHVICFTAFRPDFRKILNLVVIRRLAGLPLCLGSQ